MTPPLPPAADPCCQSLALRAAIDAGDVVQVIELAWRCHGPALLLRFRRAGFSRLDAEEMLGDVMALAFEQWGRFDGGNLCAWLNTLARYEILSRRRIASRQRLQLAPSVEIAGSVDPVDAREMRQIAAIVEEVGEQQEGVNREIFRAVFDDRLDVAQVAARLEAQGTPLKRGVISKRLARIRDQIERRMAELGLSNRQ